MAKIQIRSFFLLLPFILLASSAYGDGPKNSISLFGDRSTVNVQGDTNAATYSTDPVIAAQSFIEANASALKVQSPAEDLSLTSVVTDSLSTKHVHYAQVINNIPVWGAELTVHLDKNGKVTSATGSVSELGSLDTDPSISEERGIEIARTNFEDEFGAKGVVTKSVRLVVLDENLIDRNRGTKLHLAWEVRLLGDTAHSGYKYLVDAHNGEVIHKFSLVKNLYRQVYDCSRGDGNCYLDKPDFNYTYGRSEFQGDRGLDPHHGAPDTDYVFYGIGYSHNYFSLVHLRNGANFFGGLGNVVVNPLLSDGASFAGEGNNSPRFFIGGCPNANWDPDRERLSFCLGLPIIDIAGHEYTHAVEHFSILDGGNFSGFVGTFESGALSEGFSDVFGEAIERFAFGSHDWILGAVPGYGSPIQRDLINPEGKQLPATMYSGNYICGGVNNDAGGIHSNCVILGHAAYLLAVGGIQSGCNISGIGDDKQQLIFYRALTTYLSPTSNFAGAYSALLTACNDIFGPASNECRQTKIALNSVMMNQPGRCSGVPSTNVDCLGSGTGTGGGQGGTPDLCPTDPGKIAPGACGCGVPDSDGNGNGIFDCDVNSEFRDAAQKLKGKIGKLSNHAHSNKQKKTQRSVKSQIRALLNQLSALAANAGGQIQLKSNNTSITKLVSKAKGSVRKALNTGSSSFTDNKRKAKSAASKLLKSLA